MSLMIYNTASHKEEEFKPWNSECVTMYTCGPTVYHFAHIGNLRTYIMEDILEKAKLMNQLYTDYLQHQDSIYDMIKQNNLSKNEVDAFYNQIREIRNALLGNTKNKEYYQHAQDILSHIYTNIK